ncbi:hypothetical protein DFJ74DRAFT_712505 [Hyaloraphidium curvatum]|nr:hypothetical protein DFJ74DRAFT_712505 [Hyaloraphidium curvatum]
MPAQAAQDAGVAHPASSLADRLALHALLGRSPLAVLAARLALLRFYATRNGPDADFKKWLAAGPFRELFRSPEPERKGPGRPPDRKQSEKEADRLARDIAGCFRTIASRFLPPGGAKAAQDATGPRARTRKDVLQACDAFASGTASLQKAAEDGVRALKALLDANGGQRPGETAVAAVFRIVKPWEPLAAAEDPEVDEHGLVKPEPNVKPEPVVKDEPIGDGEVKQEVKDETEEKVKAEDDPGRQSERLSPDRPPKRVKTEEQ